MVILGGGGFMECSDVLLTTQFAVRKVLVTGDAFLCVAHTLQSALGMGQKAIIVVGPQCCF